MDLLESRAKSTLSSTEALENFMSTLLIPLALARLLKRQTLVTSSSVLGTQ